MLGRLNRCKCSRSIGLGCSLPVPRLPGSRSPSYALKKGTKKLRRKVALTVTDRGRAALGASPTPVAAPSRSDQQWLEQDAGQPQAGGIVVSGPFTGKGSCRLPVASPPPRFVRSPTLASRAERRVSALGISALVPLSQVQPATPLSTRYFLPTANSLLDTPRSPL